MRISLTTPTASAPPEWVAYVRAHAGADWYHDPRWCRVFERAYGMHSVFCVAREGERVVGGAHLVVCPRVPLGQKLVAGPFLAAGGLLLDGDIARADVEDALLTEARRQGFTRVELRDHDSAAVPAAGDLVTLRRELPDSTESLWDTLDPKVRNQVRKAQKHGLVVSRGSGEVEALWGLYARHQWRLGTPTHSRAFFAAVVEAFGEAATVWVVRKDGEPVGGLIGVQAGGTTVALNACSRKEYNSLCVNHVLYWEALAGAVQRGARRFDFGRSVQGSGTYDFKRQWDALPVRLRYRVLGAGRSAAPTESETLKSAAKLWTKLPFAVACWLGPKLRPYVA